MVIQKDGDRFFFVHKNRTDSSSEVVDCLIDGKSVDFCKVSSPEANQLARWQLITKELEFAEEQLSLATSKIENSTRSIIFDRRDTEGVMLKSLIDSAIVGYIKCFNQTKGRKVKLEVREMFDKDGEHKLLDHHIAVRELRDSYIAHAGIIKNEGSHMIACVDETPISGRSKESVIAHSMFIMPELEFIKATLRLVQYVKSRHIEKHQRKLNEFFQKVIDDPVKFGVESVFQPRA